VFKHPFEIQCTDIDFLGHVNNAKYVEYFEQCRWHWLKKNDWTLDTIYQKKVSPIVLGINVSYRAELKMHDKITISCEVLSYKGKIGHIKQEMLKDDEKLAATMDLTFGLFDMSKRKLLKPTPEWLKVISAEQIWVNKAPKA
jgi:thioesterase III